ncbi:MAG: ABC transporter ATP-binding protein [Chitinophagales bacterium]|nr:ABC transporter ATP-binding protein [Chitinophagales bacterium]
MIIAKNISKRYGSLAVLKDVDIQINKGEVVCIVGPSGAGKSTLLHIIGTLDKADKGTLSIDGVQMDTLTDKKLSAFRNKHIGFVFQFHHLLPEFTALENVCIPGFIAGTNDAKVKERAKELLDFMGLSHRFNHKPSELSGGEQQRVSVARALLNQPAVILADEPTGNLDSTNASDLHHLFFKLRDELNQTFVIVTHNEQFADTADRKLVMRDGKFL